MKISEKKILNFFKFYSYFWKLEWEILKILKYFKIYTYKEFYERNVEHLWKVFQFVFKKSEKFSKKLQNYKETLKNV